MSLSRNNRRSPREHFGCFVAIDSDWRVRYINKAGSQMVSEKLWIGCNFWDAYAHLIGTPLEEAYRRAANERVPVEFEHFNKAWARWFEVRIFPAADKALSVFFRDITERKRGTDQLRDLRLALET